METKKIELGRRLLQASIIIAFCILMIIMSCQSVVNAGTNTQNVKDVDVTAGVTKFHSEILEEIISENGGTIAIEDIQTTQTQIEQLDEEISKNIVERDKTETDNNTVENKTTETVENEEKIQLEESETQQSYMDYSESDLDLLANVMWLEEGTYADDDAGKYVLQLCGSVVIHRMESTIFPDTMEGVIYQKGQYAKRTRDLIGQVEIPEKVYEWAKELLEKGPLGPKNLVFQDNRRHGTGTYETYGNQYFCITDQIPE